MEVNRKRKKAANFILALTIILVVVVPFFPLWGKYILGETLTESIISSWFYIPVSVLFLAAVLFGGVVLSNNLSNRRSLRFRESPEIRKIRKEGRPATAIVVAVGESDESETETDEGFERKVLTLEINDGVRKRFLLATSLIVSYADTTNYRQGASLNVMVDEADPEKIAIIGPLS